MFGLSHRRARQSAVTGGLGNHDSSPNKKRNEKRKTQVTTSSSFDAAAKKRRLEATLIQLLAPHSSSASTDKQIDNDNDWEDIDMDETPIEPTLDDETLPQPENEIVTQSDDGNCKPKGRPKRLTPNQATQNLYDSWRLLLPTLVDDLLAYTSDSVGSVVKHVEGELHGECTTGCISKVSKITCLYYDREFSINMS